MVKRKVVIMAVAALMAVGTIIGGTMAAYQASTQTDKTISTSSIDVQLDISGTKVASDGTVVYTTADIQDGTVKEQVKAVNSGERKIYVRVKINKAWYEGTDKVFNRDDRTITSDTIGIRLANESDWIIPAGSLDSNQEDIYIYYTKVLEPKQTTSSLMEAFTLLKDVTGNTNQYAGLTAKIRFDADAIQTTAAKDAMLAEWGVIATFDSNGTLTAVSNQ